MTKLILGSTSKPRQLLLERLKIPFEVAAPNIDESPLDKETSSELVLRLAKLKAQKVAELFTDALIIGADQVGVLGHSTLCKPHTQDNAILQLQNMSGQWIEFQIGLCLLDTQSQTHQLSLEKFSVKLKKLTQPMIETYLSKEKVLECAGSFKAEGLGIALVDDFKGQDFSALIGLPLIRLVKMLEKVGMSPL